MKTTNLVILLSLTLLMLPVLRAQDSIPLVTVSLRPAKSTVVTLSRTEKIKLRFRGARGTVYVKTTEDSIMKSNPKGTEKSFEDYFCPMHSGANNQKAPYLIESGRNRPNTESTHTWLKPNRDGEVIVSTTELPKMDEMILTFADDEAETIELSYGQAEPKLKCLEPIAEVKIRFK